MGKATFQFSGAVAALMLGAQAVAAEPQTASTLNPLEELIQARTAEAGCSGADFEALSERLGQEGRNNAALMFLGRMRDLPTVPSGNPEADLTTLVDTQDFAQCFGGVEKTKASLAGLAEPGEEVAARSIAATIFSASVREAALLPDKNEREAAIDAALEAHVEVFNATLERELGSVITAESGVPDLGIDLDSF